MKVYALAFLALVGCGAAVEKPKEEPRPTTVITDEQVQEYYDQFIQLCNQFDSANCHTYAPKLQLIKIVNRDELTKLMPANPKAVGLCSIFWKGPRTNVTSSNVYLLDNNGYDKNWYPDELRALLFHELGHCLLQLDHPNPARPATDPAIMNYQMYQLKVYQSNWDAMVTELFTN